MIAASCGPAKEGNSNENQTEGETQASENPAAADFAPGLPESGFGGETINFLVRGGDDYEWDAIDIYAAEETGDVVNDAIYRRNRTVENRYDVSIAETPVSVNDGNNTVNRIVKSGDMSCHAVVANGIESFAMATNNLLLDLHEIPYVSLKGPWWDTALNRDMSILDKQFYAACATNIMAYDATWIAMFNKKMLVDKGYSPTNIYDMVKSGKWTLSSYIELTKDYIVDIDGDNKMTDKDQYGTSGQGDLGTGFYIGAGMRYIEKDENNRLVLKPFDERAANVLELVAEICKTEVGFNSHGPMNKSGYPEYGRTLLAENRSLFFTETLLCVRALRDMADDFGVVPMPKYDESQQKYISLVHHWAASLTLVHATCPDIEMTGVIIEEMAYQSHKSVLPVYFDIAINGKYLRDEESIEMIDYIMENRVVELALANNYGNLAGNILAAIYSGRGDFASIYEKAEAAVIKRLESIMESLE
jgi:hypothetical protein